MRGEQRVDEQHCGGEEELPMKACQRGHTWVLACSKAATGQGSSAQPGHGVAQSAVQQPKQRRGYGFWQELKARAFTTSAAAAQQADLTQLYLPSPYITCPVLSPQVRQVLDGLQFVGGGRMDVAFGEAMSELLSLTSMWSPLAPSVAHLPGPGMLRCHAIMLVRATQCVVSGLCPTRNPAWEGDSFAYVAEGSTVCGPTAGLSEDGTPSRMP